LCSRIGNTLVACEEASVGRPTIYPPCFSSYHWSLYHRCQQAEPSKPPNWDSPQLATTWQEQQAQARTRSREGAAHVDKGGPNDDDNFEHNQVDVRLFFIQVLKRIPS
jgi:hypothetical protein